MLATRRKSRPQPAPLGVELDPVAVTTNGLTADDTALLERSLRQVEAIDAKRCMLGNGEALAVVKLISDIKTRLDPPSPQSLADRCQGIIDGLRLTVDWVRAALASAESNRS
jgi:hypothetical protein